LEDGKYDNILGNKSIELTNKDLSDIEKVRESLGEQEAFRAKFADYNLQEYPILEMFSSEFFNRTMKFK
jgi:hypothetical protein